MAGRELTNTLHITSFTDGAIAGAVAGSVVEAVLYPIDTIKTRLQAGLQSLTSCCCYFAFCNISNISLEPRKQYVI